jgi:hypothetical protein
MRHFADSGVSRGQRNRVTLSLFSVFYTVAATLFFQVASHEVNTVPDTPIHRIYGSAGNGTRDLLNSSQELWTLDHRGGPIFKTHYTYIYIDKVIMCLTSCWTERTGTITKKRIGRMVSSGMLRHVALVRTGVLEAASAFFIRMTRISELGTILAAACVGC